jgi:hypothetical protein
VSSFLLGRLSVAPIPKEESIIQNIKSNDESIQKTSFYKNNITSPRLAKTSIPDNTINTFPQNKNYVASKNGKLYYTTSCSGVKRLSEKNMIWFSTSTEAENAGYKKSPSCK